MKDKDEEKAEEYFCEHCENSFEHDNGHCSNCSKWDYFILGLAEGRKEKWHDLIKNPNDLPEPLHSVIVAYKNNSLGTLFTSQGYLGAMNIWNVDGFSPYKVFAWCELPRYEE